MALIMRAFAARNEIDSNCLPAVLYSVPSDTTLSSSSSSNLLSDVMIAICSHHVMNSCPNYEMYTYCYMCEVSLVVALALLQQCNSTTLAFP
jgi:hypothetical protein